ncbi:MAG: hypothetical protein Q9227_001823 [Pyrenula ochraceoflavens]
MAAPTTSASFKQMPPELIAWIMRSVSLPEDLFAFILTCRRMNQIFNNQKSSMLSSVVQNAIHPYALADAINAVRCSKISKLVDSSTDTESTKLTITHFCQTYAKKENCIVHQGRIDEPTATALCRLYSGVHFFLSDFTASALESLRASTSAQIETAHNFGSKSVLSSTERGRLQRAFFRFEIFRRLFRQPLHRDDSTPFPDGKEQAELFLSHFPAWEIEELACIHQYLQGAIEKEFDKIEDELVERLELFAYPGSSFYSNNPGTWLETKNFEWFGFGFLSEYEKQIHHADYAREFFFSRGLQFMKRFIESDEKDRLTIVMSVPPWLKFEAFLQEALTADISSSKRPSCAVHKGEKQAFQGDTLEKQNHGWLWANGYEPTAEYYLHQDWDLRRLGYVFWDNERLEESGIFCSVRKRQSLFADPEGYCDRSKMPSVPDRLGKVVRCSWTALESLEPSDEKREEISHWIDESCWKD